MGLLPYPPLFPMTCNENVLQLDRGDGDSHTTEYISWKPSRFKKQEMKGEVRQLRNAYNTPSNAEHWGCPQPRVLTLALPPRVPGSLLCHLSKGKGQM